MKDNKVCVVGLGYVGITLSVVLAEKGFEVLGIDLNRKVIDMISRKEAHLFEPGVEDLLKENVGKSIFVSDTYPEELPKTIIICVSTPVDLATGKPNLGHLQSAVSDIKQRISEGTLVIVRSTVPIGTSRSIVLPEICSVPGVKLTFCPERTIQGQALREIQELPQIIGSLDEPSEEAAVSFFERITPLIETVGSLEAAEMIKLICNCHTDMIYSYGNEVALMAENFGLDPIKLIKSANNKYPRPDINLPGFVGGGCLTKDPYILIESFSKFDYVPSLVQTARKKNEYMPGHVARDVKARLERAGKKLEDVKIFFLGFAYKGVPETDDIRGSPAEPFIEYVSKYSSKIVGHDYVVSDELIKASGAHPVSIEEGFENADCVVFLNNSPKYAGLDIETLVQSMRKPAVLIDCWRIFGDRGLENYKDLDYGGIGY